MSFASDGVVKYDSSRFVQIPPLPEEEYLPVEEWRKRLHRLGLIGVTTIDGQEVGVGNISQKMDYQDYQKSNTPQFIVTGTQTGSIRDLNGNHYCRVVDFDIDRFALEAHGPINASSEALTHAAVYKFNRHVNAVIHIHCQTIWKGMLARNYDSIGEDIPYGSKEMALAIGDVIGKKEQGIIVMKGHEDGVIAYGSNLTITGNLILDVYKKFVDKLFIY